MPSTPRSLPSASYIGVLMVFSKARWPSLAKVTHSELLLGLPPPWPGGRGRGRSRPVPCLQSRSLSCRQYQLPRLRRIARTSCCRTDRHRQRLSARSDREWSLSGYAGGLLSLPENALTAGFLRSARRPALPAPLREPSTRPAVLQGRPAAD